MFAPASTRTSPEPALTVTVCVLEPNADCAPMNASTVPDTVPLATRPAPAPKMPMLVACVVASPWRSLPFAITVRLPAVTFMPSPTYARVTPLTSPLGSITEIAPTPTAAPLATPNAFMTEVAVTLAAPERLMKDETLAGVGPEADARCASTTPDTTAVASTKFPAPRPTVMAMVVAVALYSVSSAATVSVVPSMLAPWPA